MTADEYKQQRKQADRTNRSGRPAENPFHSSAVEADFIRRAQNVVKKFFDSSPENTKKPFVLSSTCHMGKTAFWAFIYFYYTTPYISVYTADILMPFPLEERPLVSENLFYFVNLLTKHLGEEFVGTRPAISKKVAAFRKLGFSPVCEVDFKSLNNGVEMLRYLKIYRIVLRAWEYAGRI